MLKLPKGILTHPNASQIEEAFRINLRLLFAKGRLEVPLWPFHEAMRAALVKAYSSKHLIQGLQSQPGQDQKQRLSRLLLLSNDGSERFYHSAESILLRHGDRTLGCVIDATADQLGQGVTKKSNPAKALLIDERKALEVFLLEMNRASSPG
jgi:hypothetical protein